MRLRLLDRYVLSELLYPFIFGIASFSSIFIASSMLLPHYAVHDQIRRQLG